ncbi:formimidoylglutamase [Hippea maritima]|uniref:Formimidoylglutamase n=1 Tax=Hippea maritima (strain ATCC 700847 / DSM 10411 / MH2) TaxID=760142 RepID=F2LUI6_HIPMA|nr:formimidoylglutamase [Hippea maritima]AEA34576.1 Formimidoylglutamase [Hippea maritima DSM 10411]
MSVWSGRVDGDKKDQLRWHQIVRVVDIDQIEKKNGFCIVGFASDEGIKRNKGRVGAKEGPTAIRRQLSSLAWHFDDITLYDVGDIEVIDDLEEGQEKLSSVVAEIINRGLFPIVLGGGHEVAFGSIKGAYKGLEEPVAVVNFDAHFDLREEEVSTSGTPFRQIERVYSKDGFRFDYLCVGIQRAANTLELFERAKELGVSWIDIDMIRFNTKAAIKLLSDFLKDKRHIHLTICSDVFAQSVAPGVSAPTPFGLSIDEFLSLFYVVLKSGKIVSFDIAEVSPALDRDNATSKLAAYIVFRLVDGIVSNDFFKV